MHNASVQQLLVMVSPNLNLTIVRLHVEAEFLSKHVVPFRCSCPPFIASLSEQTLAGFPDKGKQSNGRLADILLGCSVEWYERTPNVV
ncbi:hypothetical protein TNCV_5017891 [Trichonephila clavipes]|nr:hypothetical protein TNCV_5017891 [Trichonephila clavipes]